MSSFDQSRGFGAGTSGFARQSSWTASEGGWGAVGSVGSPPLAPAPAHPPRPLDYSLVEDPDDVHGGFVTATVEPQLDSSPLVLEDSVSVHLSPNLKGSILQRHHVWVVQSSRGSTERRYSDFVALLDQLARRYPFRLLPSVPPKSIQYQGHFIGQDDGFLERRKRGLERCLNSLVNHPVLKRDHLVLEFLASDPPPSPSRQASLAEESSTVTLSPAQLASVPRDVELRFHELRAHVAVQIEAWTKLAVLVERVAHRRLNQSNEWDKLAAGVRFAVDLERDVARTTAGTDSTTTTTNGSHPDRADGAITSKGADSGTTSSTRGGEGGGGRGLNWRPRHLATVDRELSTLSESLERVATDERHSCDRLFDGWVDDVKRHRELYLNLRDLFHRQQTVGVDHLDKLEKRLAATTLKLETLRSTSPPPPSYALDVERLSSGIDSDQRSIEAVKRRREFIQWSVWQEVNWVFRCTSLLRRNMKSFVESEERFGTAFTSVWTQLRESGLGDESNGV